MKNIIARIILALTSFLAGEALAESSSFAPTIPLYRPQHASLAPVWPNEIKAVEQDAQRRLERAKVVFAMRIENARESFLNYLLSIGYLDPELKAKAEKIYKQLYSEYGYQVIPTEGFRSPERQNELMMSGLSVTTVGAMRSCHQFGLAIDSVVIKNGRPSYDMSDEYVSRGFFVLGELAAREGLEWGGNWTTIKDYAHIELKEKCRIAKRSADAYFASLNLPYRYRD